MSYTVILMSFTAISPSIGYVQAQTKVSNILLLYFFRYEKTIEEIRLSQVSKNGRKLFACAAPWADADPFYVQVRLTLFILDSSFSSKLFFLEVQ
jgi:hypothetical protein